MRAHSPVFAPLGQRERLELAARMRSEHFQRNEVIFHRDDPAGHVYLIASGTVKVSVPDEGGQEVVIALHRGGDVFGEISPVRRGAPIGDGDRDDGDHDVRPREL